MKTRFSLKRTLMVMALVAALVGMAGVRPARAQDVNVTNPVTAPVNIAPPADSQPFMSSVYIFWNGSNFAFPTLVDTGDVPQGYRLIITHINLHFRLPKTERVEVEIRVDNAPQDPGDDPIRIFPLMEEQTNAWDTSRLLLVAHESVALFVENDGVMFMSITMKKAPTEPLGYVTLQGHYAKVPPARP